MSFKKSNRRMVAALLLSLGSAGSAFAQEGQESVGIVRITDSGIRSDARQSSGQSVQQIAGFGLTHGHGGGYSAGDCQNGGACRSGHNAGCQCQGCRGGMHGKFGEHYCKHSPDYGYSPPAKYPLQRRGVEYTNYYPANWYGAGADYSQSQAPMVYQPTDTTQLGFYYQHVPSWQPQPNMLPARPIPAQWHITAPAVQASRFSQGGWGGYMNGSGHYGHGNYRTGGYGVNGNCPTNGFSSQPTLIPQTRQGEEVVPSIPSKGVPAEVSPQPVQDDSTTSVPLQSVPYDPGAEPGVLPPSPNAAPAPNNVPLPNNSAASSHIKRIGYRTYR
jgi:hypothetical protein